ncbi:FemAB family XrtA/PEP-CTERM system-associated protein [Sphingomonas hylomeconis]|uniref:FemAB family XrtA/PEP-CTERM system-associated protein n=1 Tax=Sphingomonas hylomeconis TaxID=1395958 RepID=A0ABV7SWS0_9SPHN|nr:FemAB family XrtA/PEP-CTERM system-associated protein [Sphingomonas hylomeconis]
MPLPATPLAPTLTLRSVDLADPAERARIDAWVRVQPAATPFHLPAWSVAVARACGHKSHTLVAERADGSLAGMVPLTEIASPLFGRALVSNGFAVDGGILAADPAAIRVLGDGAWALAQALRCPTLELRGGPAEGPEWHRDEHTYLGFVRPLAASDEAELLAIPRKQRAEVRKSLDNDLAVEIGSGAGDRKAHYAVYAESVRNLGTPVFPAALFREVLAEFGDAADILTVRAGGAAVASVLSLYFNGTAYPYWGGGTAAARGLRANDRMYFALMAHARGRGCTRFDFGRSKAGTGPAAFKKNWGFTPQPLMYVKRAASQEMLRDINPLSPRYRAKIEMWKKLPLWAANVIGPHISKGLG